MLLSYFGEKKYELKIETNLNRQSFNVVENLWRNIKLFGVDLFIFFSDFWDECLLNYRW